MRRLLLVLGAFAFGLAALLPTGSPAADEKKEPEKGFVQRSGGGSGGGFSSDEKKEPEKGFVQLFNGNDLAGWKVHPKGTGAWKVVDHILIGSGPTSHLFSDRGDYTDFVYRVEAKIAPRSNSGQYFRTKFEGGFPSGYEAQINSTHGDTIRTGSLYPDGRLKLAAGERQKLVITDMLVKPDEWFTQEVTAIGNHIVIKVNGKTTVDWTDPKSTYLKGHFALQQHDPGSTVSFRKIEVKELASGK